jgi:hypothetical protein
MQDSLGMYRPADTTIEAHRVHVELMREAPGWKKLELAAELYEGLTSVALAGLKARHEGATESELRRRLADILLGAELAERAYGPIGEW